MHTVSPGDHLSRIANIYNVPIQQLIELNNLGSNEKIYAGQILRIKKKNCRGNGSLGFFEFIEFYLRKYA